MADDIATKAVDLLEHTQWPEARRLVREAANVLRRAADELENRCG